MNSDQEEKLAKSLSAETTELLPVLPYLLQDLWELGANPESIKELVSRHIHISGNSRLLDLACGKGAVSIGLAKEFRCKTKGIDIIPDFIGCANQKAVEHSLEDLCEFRVGNICESIQREKEYDITVLAAAGDLLGDARETIFKLAGTVKKGGYLIIDDVFSRDVAVASNSKYLSREQWLQVFRETRMKLIAEKTLEYGVMVEVNERNQNAIIKRAEELKVSRPELRELLDGYIQSQQTECDDLEVGAVGVTWLLQTLPSLAE